MPVVFVIDGDNLYFAVDAKPKQTKNLKRLRNIAINPLVSVLVDHYEDDWTRLWWVRVDGTAHVVIDEAQARLATDLLVETPELGKALARSLGKQAAVVLMRSLAFPKVLPFGLRQARVKKTRSG